MRGHAGVALVGSIALLAFVVAAPVWSHGIAWALGFVAARALAPELRRGLGSARQWGIALLALALLGALFGREDAKLASVPVSTEGALAATTMIARAFALVGLSTSLLVLYPPSRVLPRLAGTRLRRVGEVVLIAVELLPSLIVVLREARTEGSARHPRWRVDRRLFGAMVLAIGHAADLADDLSRSLASSGERKEPG